MNRFWILFISLLTSCCWFSGCSNSPYPDAVESDDVVYYTAFSEAPASLDPQKAYNVRDGIFVGSCYEGLFTYDYLERPLKMIPQLAKSIPTPKIKRNAKGDVEEVRYSFELNQGVYFIDDPCFPGGKGRELKASDFLFAFKRLVDPKTACPIATNFMRIKGLSDYRKRLIAVYEAHDEAKKDKVEEEDENGRKKSGELPQVDAIAQAGDISGIQVTGEYSFDMVMEQPYPQILYWLAMNFISAIPHEAVKYYNPDDKPERGDIHHKNEPLEFAKRAVGTGVFRFDWASYNREAKIVLLKNENWWGLTQKAPSTIFPEKPSCPDDVEKDCWAEATAGKNLPFVDRVEFHVERESLPKFSKFLQGYYDRSGIPIEGFGQAIQNEGLTPEMQELGIRLVKENEVAVRYVLFNLDDDLIGMPTKFKDPKLEANREVEIERRRKVRQALSLAIDMQEFHDKFYNGLGVLAQSPIPPGVFGYDPEYKNPYRQYDPSLTRAKELLKEAGFEGGIDQETGKPLELTVMSAATTPPGTLYFQYYANAWAELGVKLNIESSDYNQFMTKVYNKNASYQVLSWGWMMDYPDPENFLFLLYGPNSGKYSDHSVNYARYENPRYDELFEAMETMTNDESREVEYTDAKTGEAKKETLSRMEIIVKMRDILENDAPWIPTTHEENYILSHDWIHGVKQHPVTGAWFKYYSFDVDKRSEKRSAWNKPLVWPAFIFIFGFLLFLIPALVSLIKERR